MMDAYMNAFVERWGDAIIGVVMTLVAVGCVFVTFLATGV